MHRGVEQGRRAEVPHLAADLAALIAHRAAEREDVARDDTARMQHHVATHRHQVAQQLAEHVGSAVHDQQVTREALVGGDAEIAEPRAAVRHGDADAAVARLQRRPEL